MKKLLKTGNDKKITFLMFHLKNLRFNTKLSFKNVNKYATRLICKHLLCVFCLRVWLMGYHDVSLVIPVIVIITFHPLHTMFKVRL